MKVHCPICGGGKPYAVYAAQRQPTLLNHLHDSRQAACEAPHVDLDFKGCSSCGFVWNAAFDPDSIQYGPGYINDQSESRVFRRHLNEVSNRLLDRVAKTPGAIIEIGCGQGAFLKSLCKRASRSGIGFDPAYQGSVKGEDDVVFKNELFNSRSADALIESHPSISLIICRHVLEHLVNPAMMVETFAGLMRANPTAVFYLEVPAIEWIAEHAAFYDFFNEHCSLFSTDAMQRMLMNSGLKATHIARVFQGQYLAVEAMLGQSNDDSRLIRPSEKKHDQLTGCLGDEKTHWGQHLEQLLATGPVVIWGAGAKGVSVVNQLGMDFERIPLLIDINPAKHGRFVPLTAQEINGPEAWRSSFGRGSSRPTVIVMNPNYMNEVAELLRVLRIDATIELIARSNAVEVHS